MNDPLEPIAFRESPDGVSFSVQVQPCASHSKVTGIKNGAIRLRLTSPPVDGAANAHCIDLFAALFGVRKRDVTILTGETSRQKVVKVAGITPQLLQERVAQLLA